MVDKDDSKTRKRMVVEEIESPKSLSSNELISSSQVLEKPEIVEETKKTEPEILDEAVSTEEPAIATTEPIIESNPEPILKSPEKPIKVEKQKSPIFWILIPGIFILGAILGGIFFYQKGVNITNKETPTPTPIVSEASPTPSASPSATLDLTKYTISVLNGSGIVGEAGKVKTLITDAGFKVGTTGNAATYDYTKTIIKAKSTVDKSFLAKLSETLAKEYVVGDSESLSSSSTTDVQIVVGTSKAE